MQFCMYFHFRLHQIDTEKYKDEEKNNISSTPIFSACLFAVLFFTWLLFCLSFLLTISPTTCYFFILFLFVFRFPVLFLLHVLPRCLCAHQHLCVYSPSSLRNALSAPQFSQIDNAVFLSALIFEI